MRSNALGLALKVSSREESEGTRVRSSSYRRREGGAPQDSLRRSGAADGAPEGSGPADPIGQTSLLPVCPLCVCEVPRPIRVASRTAPVSPDFQVAHGLY